jgi:hypothetical protein
MNTKLTLTLNSHVIESAKTAARQSGRSLSDLVENYLIAFIALHKGKTYAFLEEGSSMIATDSAVTGYSDQLLSLKGIIKDNGLDYKEQLDEIRRKSTSGNESVYRFWCIAGLFLDRQPFSDHSAAILDLCEKRNVIGITSPLVLNNIYYILLQSAGHEKTMKCVHLLINQLQTLTMIGETVVAAINSEFKDFEDSLQYGAVVSYESIHCIVTRNIKDYRKSTVAVHTPAGFLALL